MSNPAVVKLERNQVNKSTVWLDDNFGESIHIHIDDIRVDLTVQEFKKLNDELCVILNDLVRVDGFDISKIDPVYMSLWLWPKLSSVTKVRIDNVHLEDMYIRSMDGRRIEKLSKSVELKALRGSSDENENYRRQSNHFGQSDTERLYGLLESITKNGYPFDGRYIIMFGDDNLIRDGQHRASCLYYLYGNIEIPVMRIYFKDKVSTIQSMPKRKLLFYNSSFGYFIRTSKNRMKHAFKGIRRTAVSTIKATLRGLGVSRKHLERNIYRLESEIDLFSAK